MNIFPNITGTFPSVGSVTQAAATWNFQPDQLVLAFVAGWFLGFVLRMIVRMIQRTLGAWFE
ncbi:MAG: hypothetical protein ACYCSN_18340 [Acidobacteriaceae bacterium]